MENFWQNMSWEDLEDAKNNNKIVVIPVGATEQHGLHLPVGTDSFLPFDIVRDAAAMVSTVIYTLPIWFGYSPFHMYLNGAISVPLKILYEIVEAVCRSIIDHGFKKIILFNGHGGNIDFLRNISIEIQTKNNVKIVVFSYWDLVIDYINKWRDSQLGGINHAGEMETSLMLYKHEDLVKKDKFKKNIYCPKTKFLNKDLTARSVVFMCTGFKELSDSGVLGDPTVATKEKGRKLYRKILSAFVEFIEDFSKWDLGNPSDI